MWVIQAGISKYYVDFPRWVQKAGVYEESEHSKSSGSPRAFHEFPDYKTGQAWESFTDVSMKRDTCSNFVSEKQLAYYLLMKRPTTLYSQQTFVFTQFIEIKIVCLRLDTRAMSPRTVPLIPNGALCTVLQSNRLM